MQISIIALLAAISTAVSAAPVDSGVSPATMDNDLVAPTHSTGFCCEKDDPKQCKSCDNYGQCPIGHDKYTECTNGELLQRLGLFEGTNHPYYQTLG